MKVSILIPIYNSEKYLRQTIESAISQTWADKEIILVDDGSTDNSLAIAKSFESDSIKVYTQANLGACRARNRAFSESSGAYIQYLDADDLLSEDKITNQIALINNSNTNAVLSCSWIRFYKDEEMKTIHQPFRFLDKDWSDPTEWLKNAWEGRGMGQTSIWLTPRHLIEKAGPWNEQLSINQDGDFFCRVLLESSSIVYSKNSFVYYRSGISSSISQIKNMRKVTDILTSYRLYQEYILKKIDTLQIRKALCYNYLTFIYEYYDHYPELVIKAKRYLLDLDIENTNVVGGKYFRMFSGIIGFNNALKIRSIARQITVYFR